MCCTKKLPDSAPLSAVRLRSPRRSVGGHRPASSACASPSAHGPEVAFSRFLSPIFSTELKADTGAREDRQDAGARPKQSVSPRLGNVETSWQKDLAQKELKPQNRI